MMHDRASQFVDFPTTHWTRIFDARDDKELLSELLQRYRPPIYAFFRLRSRSEHDAEDLTQSFLDEVWLGRNLIGRVQREGSRFRTYLLAALNRFRIDGYRRKRRELPLGTICGPGDDFTQRRFEPHLCEKPHEAFERAWATTVLNHALARTRDSLCGTGLHLAWEAFEIRIVQPAMAGCTPQSLGEIANEIGATGERQMWKLLHVARQRFHASLRDVVAETVTTRDELEDEIHHLGDLLGIQLPIVVR